MKHSSDVVMDSPAKYFRLAVREIRERVKLCEEISSNMEDLAEIENSFGKSLVKLGRQSVTLSASTDQPAIALNNLWDNVFTMCEKLGKQHMGFSICISQSIGRTFTNFSNEHRNNVQEIVSHIQDIADDLKKSRKNYKKSYEKYVKLGQDIENCILSRNASIKEVSERSSDSNEEGFINRSLTMMLGKSNTTDTIKKLHDRYKDLANEMDITEKSLIDFSVESNNIRNKLREELQKAVIKLEEMEVSRLTFIQEGLTRFCQSGEGMLEHIEQLMHDLKHQLTHMMNKNGEIDIIAKDIDAEISPVDTLKWKDTVFIPDIDVDSYAHLNNGTAITTTNTSSTFSSMTKDMTEMANLFAKLDKLRVFLKMLRNNTKHALHIMVEISDTERTYAKSCQIVFEKYGCPRHVITLTPLSPTSRNERGQSTSASSSNSNSTSTVATLSCAELVSLIEAPYTRRGWDMAIRAFCGFSDAHLKVAEMYSDSCRTAAEATHRRLISDKKDVKDRQINSAKKLDVARSSLSKLLTKLSRVRRELKERRAALKKMREQEVGNTGEGTTDSPVPTYSASAIEPISTSSTVSSTATTDLLDTQVIPSVSTTVASESESPFRKSDKEKNSNTSSGSSVLQGLQSLENFGNVLGAVVGLESTSDRTLRLENRITQLEEEEIACMESLMAMQTSVTVLQQSARQDMLQTIDSSKSALHNAISNIIRVNMQIQETQIQSVLLSRKVIHEVRVCLEEMRLESDINFFANIIRSSADLPTHSTEKAVTQELPPDIVFIPFRSDIIDKERKKERHISTTSLSNASSSSNSNNNIQHSKLINSINNSNSITSKTSSAKVTMSPGVAVTATTDSKAELPSAATPTTTTMGSPLSTSLVNAVRPASTSSSSSSSSPSQKVNNQMEMMTSVTAAAVIISSTSSSSTPSANNDGFESNKSPIIPCSASASPPTRSHSLSAPAMVTSSRDSSTNNSSNDKRVDSPLTTMTTPISRHLSGRLVSNDNDSNNNNNDNNDAITTATALSNNDSRKILSPSSSNKKVTINSNIVDPNIEEEDEEAEEDEEDEEEEGESDYESNDSSDNNNSSNSNSDDDDDDEEEDKKYKMSAPTEESVIMNIDEYSTEVMSSSSSSFLTRSLPSLIKINNNSNVGSGGGENTSYTDLTTDFSQPLYAVAASVGITLPWSTTATAYPTATSSSIPPPLPVQESPFAQELARFNLSSSDKVLEFFSCALYPKRGMLTHGRLFITQQYLAFSGWPETRLLLSLQQIAIVEKTSIFFVPSALLVTTAVGEEYFFGSFLDRDQCYTLLTCMIQIAKSLVQVEVGISLHDELRPTTSNKTAATSSTLTIGSSNSSNDMNGSTSLESATNISSSSFLLYEPIGNDGVELINMFVNFGVTLLGEHTYTSPLALLDVWKHYWQDCHGYQTFLDSEGDFDIKYSEWLPVESKSVLEDVCALPFSYSRKITYLHPRTSMLMFGPKNAPSTQIQYLYVLPAKLVTNTALAASTSSNGEGVSESLTMASTTTTTTSISSNSCVNGILPYHFVILTVTQFDGIPLSDTFKVLQYFTFSPTSSTHSLGGSSHISGNHSHCVVRVGAKVHFVKPTIMKSRVTSGVEEELSVLTRKWINFSEKMILQKRNDDPSHHHGRGTTENEGILDSSQLSTGNNHPVHSNSNVTADGISSDRSLHTVNHVISSNTTQPKETSGQEINVKLSYFQIIILLLLILIIILQYLYYSNLQFRLLQLEDQLTKLLPQLTTTHTITTKESNYHNNIMTAHQLDVTSNISLLTEEFKKLSKHLYSTNNDEL